MLELAAASLVPGTGRSARGQTAAPLGEPLIVVVCSRLGTKKERVVVTDLEALAAGTWDPPSVVLLLPQGALEANRPANGIAWSGTSQSWLGGAIFGRDPAAFLHRDAMASQPEVRATVFRNSSCL